MRNIANGFKTLARPQDLFLDALIDAPARDEQATMEHPHFALEKRPRMEPIRYEYGPVKIEVSAGPKGSAACRSRRRSRSPRTTSCR